MATHRSPSNGKQPPPPAPWRKPAQIASALRTIAAIGDAEDPNAVLQLFIRSVADLGCESGIFLSCLRDDATRSSYRSLLACDPLWGTEYARQEWFECDPWLRHAIRETEPIRSQDLRPASKGEQAFMDSAAEFGFATALIVPAPTCAGQSRVGVLCLGAADGGLAEGEDYPMLKVLSRALAMELHCWLQASISRELQIKSQITTADLELLRHLAAGRGSKAIGAAMNLDPKTVDCRFQRICAKLLAPDRRSALRIARLYGLLQV